MKKLRHLSLILLLLPSLPFSALAEEGASAAPSFVYYTMQPEITTNYITSGAKVGFINVKVQLMLEDPTLEATVAYHQGLLRDALINIISKEPETNIKSMAGREALREKCLTQLNALLEAETKQIIIKDLLFTKYLYQ
ncbi:flagellar basal body-associated protein FliL [Veronia pacifica]|uniref:Flagellar protein FliL n=2 Tax=Veronia pacifica TaxID=1080227 RepID=A0A1C3EJB6_9GAMM|nr:flagellar basal body-associated protein FliL [Veronia pacifica]